MKKLRLFITTLMLSFLMIVVFGCFQVFAAGEGEAKIYQAAGAAMRYIQIIGLCASVLVICIYGIQWFIASPQEKAALKSKGWVYILGMILLLGGSTLGPIVIKLLSGLYISPVKDVAAPAANFIILL